jgi:hypothetical protein
MIEDKYIDFFIGGNINEPVAIEIPLKKVNPDQLVMFLRGYGLDIDTTGTRLDKISVTKTTMRFGEPYCSVITPALTPNDLKKTYRILETLLDKYIEKGRPSTEEIIYPHVLDLNNLATQKELTRQASKENALINTLLQEAKQSGNIIIFEHPSELADDILSDPDYKPGEYLFAGSAMSDPYTVATTMYSRYFRYASGSNRESIDYAAYYSGVFNWEKGSVDNNYVNTLPNGKPVGFLHQYEVRKDGEQLFFDDQSIERADGVTRRNTAEPKETMINRFNNPVVATYVLWKEPGSSKIYALKIPNDDERWALFKEYYTASYFEKDATKRNKINDWIAEGGKHRTYTVDEICGSYWKERLDKEEKEQQQQREKLQQEKNRKEQVKERIEQIYENIKTVPTFITCPSYTDYKKYMNSVGPVIALYKEHINKLDEFQTELETIKSLNPDFDIEFYTKQIAIKKIEIKKRIEKLNNEIKTKKTVQAKHILDMADNPQMILNEPDIDFESKCKILDVVLPRVSHPLIEERAINLATVIFNIYNILSAEEKKQFQEKFEYIKEKASRQVLKQLIKIGKDHGNDTFVFLFKTSFIDKITKALRKKSPEASSQSHVKPINIHR